ncbi:MAG: HNH endonuclease [Frankiales bacterium]|nr:HNH endonuclease [Frankiales bacterium]
MPASSSSSWRTSPLPVNWRQIRNVVIRRDGGRCVWVDYDGASRRRCAETGSGPGGRLEVDHIGDPTDHSPMNLRTLCAFHHRILTNRQAAAARRARASRNREPERHPGLL